MTEYRVAIIGCGNIAGRWNNDPATSHALTHAKAYDLHPGTKLVACCDSEMNRAREFASRWGAGNCYQSVDELLAREKVDIVSVCVPTPSHRDVVGKIARAGKGKSGGPKLVLLEKPVAASEADALALAADLNSAVIACSVNYIRRFDSLLQSVRGRIATGELGKVQQFRGRYTKGLLNNGSHLVNLLRFYFGRIERWHILDYFQELEGDPTVSLFVQFASGVNGTIQGLRESCYSVFDLDIMMEQGEIRLLDFCNRLDILKTDPDPVYPSYRVLQREPLSMKTDLANAVYHYVSQSINALEGKEEFLSPLADAIYDVTFCVRVKEAIRS